MTMPKNKAPGGGDGALWAYAMRDTRPLKKKRRDAPADGTAVKPAPKEVIAKAERPGPRSDNGAIERQPPLSPRSAPGLDRRSADRLRKGRIEIDGRLDLHGHTQEEAHRALIAFVAASVTAGRRCILVITGKGERGGGVLRAAVPAWLNEPRLRPNVLAYHPARPKDGGDGALYVLLRRARSEARG